MQTQFEALGDPRRRAILRMVHHREMAAGEVATAFPEVSRPAISQHLRVLRESGLVTERRRGTSRLYSLNPSGFKEVREFLSDFWDDRLELLKQEAEIEERTGNARVSLN